MYRTNTNALAYAGRLPPKSFWPDWRSASATAKSLVGSFPELRMSASGCPAFSVSATPGRRRHPAGRWVSASTFSGRRCSSGCGHHRITSPEEFTQVAPPSQHIARHCVTWHGMAWHDVTLHYLHEQMRLCVRAPKHTYIYIYIYMYIERERDIYIHIHVLWCQTDCQDAMIDTCNACCVNYHHWHCPCYELEL